MTDELNKLTALLKSARENLASAKEIKRKSEETVKASEEYRALEVAKTLMDAAAQAESELVKQIKKLGVEVYEADPDKNKSLNDFLEIRIFHPSEVPDKQAAFEYCKSNLTSALILDESALITAATAKGSRIPSGLVVTKDEPRVQISSKL